MAAALRISVVIPTYNRRELLANTLDSLTRQSLPSDEFEVLVCDDGSSDGTGDLVGQYRDRLGIRYFHHEDDGFQAAKTRNVGIRHARAAVCAFVDAGIIVHSGFLRAHLAAHEESAVPAAVIGYLYALDPTRSDNEPLLRAIDPKEADAAVETCRANNWLDIREAFYSRYTDDFSDEPAPWLVFWSGNISVRTEDLRAVGMFDEEFRSWGAEDADLGYRLHLAGVRIVLCRAAMGVDYPHGGSGFEANMAAQDTNFALMVRKYDTPVMDLVAATPPELYFDLNKMIRERDLPRCADVLAQRRRDS